MYPHTTAPSRTNAGRAAEACAEHDAVVGVGQRGEREAHHTVGLARVDRADQRWHAPVGEHAGHVKSRRWDVQARQQDQRLDRCRVHSGLLGRLAERGRGRPCVAGLTPAAGKGDLAGVIAELGRPLLQQDVRPVGTVGRDQDQDRGLPLGGRVRHGIVTAWFFRASRGNRIDKAHERRRHDRWPEICRSQPASEVIGQRPVHIQKSDGFLVNTVTGSGSA